MQTESNGNGQSNLNSKNESTHVVIAQDRATDKSKNKSKDKCDLGPDFVAPDGGWGWLIVFGAGLSNVSVI